MKQRKIPMRMCVGCQEMKPKKELIRIVKNKQNEISLDFTGKKPGRGTYICKDVSCYQKARKAKKIERSFGGVVSEEIYDSLQEELEGSDDG